MKKFFSVLMFLALLLPLSSCDNDPADFPIYDFSPVELYIAISDGQGNQLLAPEYAGNIVGSAITISEGSKVYEVDWTAHDRQSRDYLPDFYGAQYRPVIKWDGHQPYESDEWRIHFGELDGGDDYDRTFKVTVQDKSFELRVTNSLTWKKDKPIIERHFYLDGNEQSDSFFDLVLE